MKQQICIFTGARPNFVKVAPLIRAIAHNDECGYQLVYAGREDDPTLEPSLFSDLEMPAPDVYLGVDCENLNELTGRVMAEFEHYLEQHPADSVIVVDDLASTMAAAIVTKKRGARLAHLVAGTRSFDISMPKEINRLVIDGLSDMLFTAGIGSSSIATREGAELHKIYMVGNILMDQLRYCRDRWQRPVCLDGVEDGKYLVFTLNRKALLADEDNLLLMLQAIAREVQRSASNVQSPLPVIAPLRGLAAETVRKLIRVPNSEFRIVPSLGYLEFGWLTAHAKGIITDSGNVAEEATFNHIPCITLNSYTEHQETVKQGTNVLVGEDAERLGAELHRLLAGDWPVGELPDRWDGRTAERIVSMLCA
jgi:UDP-N-acetylglucosamine 2-epimerase (non-hydrolysing)